MMTADKVKNQIQTLIDTANEKTGKQDADLTSAVGSLVDGFGSGDDSNFEDAFWDAFQNYGNRTYCRYLFAGDGWTKEFFKPKYSIKPTNARGMFDHNPIDNIYDILDNLGLTIDFSECTEVRDLFNTSYMTRIGICDFSKVVSMTSTFASCKAVTIEKVVFNENVSYSSTFTGCTDLCSLHAEGIIGKGGLNFSWSPLLDNTSVQSVIDCLKDLTGTTSATITFHANTKAAMTETQIAQITSKNWTLA